MSAHWKIWIVNPHTRKVYAKQPVSSLNSTIAAVRLDQNLTIALLHRVSPLAGGNIFPFSHYSISVSWLQPGEESWQFPGENVTIRSRFLADSHFSGLQQQSGRLATEFHILKRYDGGKVNHKSFLTGEKH